MRRKLRYFLLSYYDDDAKTFNVIGPVCSDETVARKTIELQETGRKVRVSTSKPETDITKVPNFATYIKQGPQGYYRYDPTLRW